MPEPSEHRFRAAVFDMDGLLVDSEPLWRRAEMEVFPTVGVHLTEAQCIETTGLRIDEVVALRHAEHPWDGPSQHVISRAIVARVIELVRSDAVLLPGARTSVDFMRDRGLRLALASSSSIDLIEAVLGRFDLRDAFEVVCSAEHEAAGKPHPAVYLTAAGRLGVPPRVCLALEDSPNGVRSALAAGMTVLAVPERHPAPDDPFASAAMVLRSLDELDGASWSALAASTSPG